MLREEYTKLQKAIELSCANGGFFVSLNAVSFDTDFIRLIADDDGDIKAYMYSPKGEVFEVANINMYNIDTVQVRNYAFANGDNGLVYQYRLDAVLSEKDQNSLKHWKGVLA